MDDNFNVFTAGRRVTSVDGFWSGAGQKPRHPNFRDAAHPAPDVEFMDQRQGQQVNKTQNSYEIGSDMLPPTVNPRRSSATMSSSTAETPDFGQQPNNHPVASSANHQQMQNLNQFTTAYTPDRVLSKDEAPVRDVKRPKAKRRSGAVKNVLKVFGVLVLIGVLFFGGRLVLDIAKLTGNKNPFAFLGALNKVPLKNENGRINILVAGNSADEIGHGGAELTDSIMVLSLDTKKKTGLMLSVPRDLWVSIPGEGRSKINAAYTYGGMTNLEGVIEDTLGIPIHYNAIINYTAFRDLVDAIGGITITIDSSDPRGIYDSSLDWTSRTCCSMANYPNGPVELNGKKALNLARARGEGRGSYGFPQADFTRTEHQRLMLMAIRDKALSSATLSNPVKISNLVSAIGNNAKTNLQINEIQTLYMEVKDVDVAQIDSYNINTLKGEGTYMLENYTTPNGQSALIPAAGLGDFTDIQNQIQKIMNATPVTREAAKVVVLNGTETTGLAKTHARRLERKGMEVLEQSNADPKSKTTIIDNSKGKKPETLNDLKKTYKVSNPSVDSTLSSTYPDAEFIIIIGQDQVPNDE